MPGAFCDCCEPSRWFSNAGNLQQHSKASAARQQREEEASFLLQEVEEAEAKAQEAHSDAQDHLRGLIRQAEVAHLDACADIHLQHFMPQSAVQRHKEALTAVAAAQTQAIKAALDGKLKAGCKLEDLLDPIMRATERFREVRAEHTGREALYAKNTQVTPRARTLQGAGGKQVVVYDIPLEESMQRELYYNPVFANHFRDWLPPEEGGILRSTKDGTASTEHPMLGARNWTGHPRLGLGHYYDDVEVVNPIGAARVKHKLALHYVQVLNAPPHVRSALDLIFLVSVTLKKSQDEAGIQAVVQGAHDEPDDGTSLGATMRRLHNGYEFEVARTDGPGTRRQMYQGWLILVSGDTLAAAELIGFKKGWSKDVKSICWQCDAAGGAGCRHTMGSGLFHMRTYEQYRAQRAHTRTLPIAKKRGRTKASFKACSHRSGSCVCTQREYMTAVGVTTFQHAYRRIPLFRAIEYVPRDLMHVELEGNLKVHLYAFLYTCTSRGWVTREALNRAILAFRWPGGAYVPDIPAATLKGKAGGVPKKGGSIPYTSGQMLTFVSQSLALLRSVVSETALQSAHWQSWVAHVRYFMGLMQVGVEPAPPSATSTSGPHHLGLLPSNARWSTPRRQLCGCGTTSRMPSLSSLLSTPTYGSPRTTLPSTSPTTFDGLALLAPTGA